MEVGLYRIITGKPMSDFKLESDKQKLKPRQIDVKDIFGNWGD